jgi:uncharacterized protein YkwD
MRNFSLLAVVEVFYKAIISIILILLGLLPNYFPLANNQAIFKLAFEIGIICFVVAYFIYAVKCWGGTSRFFAVLMVTIPLLLYSLSVTKIPESNTNILLNLFIQFCLYAIISAILLYVCNKIKKVIERFVFKNTRGSYRSLPPKLTYSFIGLLIVSIMVVNYGGITMFTNNMNTAFQSTTNYGSPPQDVSTKPSQNIAGLAVQNIQATLFNQPTFTSADESMKDIDYINSIRASNGVNSIQFDNRVYNLALARVNDMDKYGYLDHTNPQTGTCAFSIKSEYGLTSDEYVAENAYGYPSGGSYHSGIEMDAINSWMSDRGHKYNMLYPHIAGAVACSSGGHCVFEGLNHDGFTNACYTAAQGEAFWATAGVQPYEHT